MEQQPSWTARVRSDEITPEQQLRNVLDVLKERTALPRNHWPTEEIRSIISQLDEMMERYFKDKLPSQTNDTPF